MKQIITTIGPGATSSSAIYTTLYGVDGFSSSEMTIQVPWSVAGTFSNLKISLFAAPGSGKSATYTLRKNGADTGLTVTFNDSDQLKIDSTHTVSVSPGDMISLKRTASTTMSSGMYYALYLEFDSSTAAQSNYSQSTGATLGAAKFGRFFYTDTLRSSGASSYSDVAPINGTVTRIDIAGTKTNGIIDSNFASGESVSVVVYKNGVAQDGTGGTPDTTITIDDTTTQTAWTGTLDIAVGDTLYIVYTPTGSSFGLQIVQMHIGICFVADIDGQFILTQLMEASDSEDRFFSSTTSTYSATETDREGIGGPTTFYISSPQIAAQTGGGIRFKATGRLNEAPASPTFQGSVSDTFNDNPIRFGFVGTTSVPASDYMVVTDTDRWAVLVAAATGLTGSVALGHLAKVRGATRSVMVNCTASEVVLTDDGTFKVSADSIVLEGPVAAPGLTVDINAALSALGE